MVDSHCHLDFPDYQTDFDSVLKRTQEALDFVVDVGTDIKSSERVVDLATQHDFIYAAVGVHPHDASTVTEETVDRLRTLASHEKVVAIGECGLDYYRLTPGQEEEEKKQQAEIFKYHIELARSRQLPLIIHCREAYDDLISILESQGSGWRGVIHCYLGDSITAEKLIALGFLISYTGIITFPNVAVEVLDSVKQVPITKMMVETDAPFLAPQVYRGKRNEPSFVVEVAKKIAQIKDMTYDEVDKVTTDNSRELFGIS